MLRYALVSIAVATGACSPVIVQPATTPTAWSPPARSQTVAVFPKGKGPDRQCEILAVLDFHSDAESEDKGFDELRARAAAAGADAVIDAEFEHGEGGESSHLSGLAVRFKVHDARAYDVLDHIVIETDAKASDKGFAALRVRAKKLGADKIVDVKFEHGEGGAPSRLMGTAVRYRP